jgi:hypothetical protein
MRNVGFELRETVGLAPLGRCDSLAQIPASAYFCEHPREQKHRYAGFEQTGRAQRSEHVWTSSNPGQRDLVIESRISNPDSYLDIHLNI